MTTAMVRSHFWSLKRLWWNFKINSHLGVRISDWHVQMKGKSFLCIYQVHLSRTRSLQSTAVTCQVVFSYSQSHWTFSLDLSCFQFQIEAWWFLVFNLRYFKGFLLWPPMLHFLISLPIFPYSASFSSALSLLVYFSCCSQAAGFDSLVLSLHLPPYF